MPYVPRRPREKINGRGFMNRYKAVAAGVLDRENGELADLKRSAAFLLQCAKDLNSGKEKRDSFEWVKKSVVLMEKLLTRDGYEILRWGLSAYPTGPQETFVVVLQPTMKKDGNPRKGSVKLWDNIYLESHHKKSPFTNA